MFDIKMDFTRKARWVKDGHRTPDPERSSCAEVVSRKIIHILLTDAAIHEVDVMSDDIRNAYLQAPTYENHFIICDADLHGIEHDGKWAVVMHAFYGGKLVCRDF